MFPNYDKLLFLLINGYILLFASTDRGAGTGEKQEGDEGKYY
jgi:hypothetical protein